MLRQYLQDPKVTAAAGQYEAAYQLFERLRTALRLSAQGDHPLHERYVLGESETQDVRQALESLQAECREQSRAAADEAMRDGYQVVLDHLERYADRLFAAEDSACRERTTNRLEGFWGASKRRCRQRHGRRQLTRDFQSLPAEYMLVGNLENPVYVELVLGELSALPRKLAEAGRTAGSWTRWRQAQQPLRVGRLPRRLVRAEDFLDTLVGVYQDQSGSDAACPVLSMRAGKSRANRNSERWGLPVDTPVSSYTKRSPRVRGVCSEKRKHPSGEPRAFVQRQSEYRQLEKPFGAEVDLTPESISKSAKTLPPWRHKQKRHGLLGGVQTCFEIAIGIRHYADDPAKQTHPSSPTNYRRHRAAADDVSIGFRPDRRLRCTLWFGQVHLKCLFRLFALWPLEAELRRLRSTESLGI